MKIKLIFISIAYQDRRISIVWFNFEHIRDIINCNRRVSIKQRKSIIIRFLIARPFQLENWLFPELSGRHCVPVLREI